MQLCQLWLALRIEPGLLAGYLPELFCHLQGQCNIKLLASAVLCDSILQNAQSELRLMGHCAA